MRSRAAGSDWTTGGHVESLRSLAGENCAFGRNAPLHLGKMLKANGSQCDQWLLLAVLNARACGWGFQSCVVRRSGARTVDDRLSGP